MYSPSSPGLTSFDSPLVDYNSNQCLKYKYFTTFLICTSSLALLSTSLATHKWIIAKPIRMLKINGGQTNFSSLFALQHATTAATDQASNSNSHNSQTTLPQQLIALNNGNANQRLAQITDNKFQGEIFFGLFSGVKLLNYGFGGRISQISGELPTALFCAPLLAPLSLI